MSPDQVALVKNSWGKVTPNAAEVASIFYGKLFEIAPQTKKMFNADMDSQGLKLVMTIGTVVRSLEHLEPILPSVQKLAVNHIKYGVEAEHYDLVGQALLDTLATGLGDEFTPDVKDAWAQAYGVLSSTMKDAAYGTETA